MTSTGTEWSSPSPAGGPVERPRRARSPRGFFAELPVLVLIAFVLALVLKTFLVQAFYIPSGSMEPTLDVGDRVLVNKVVYDVRDPRRGEIVVFSLQDEVAGPDAPLWTRLLRSLGSGLGAAQPGEKDFIKRVIGLPGETVEMRNGVVSVDGRPLPESPTTDGGYLSARDPNDFGPVTVPEGEYFMMGDNRPNSSDSRFPSLGTIPREQVIGKAFVVIWPFSRLATLPGADYGAPLSRLQAGDTLAA